MTARSPIHNVTFDAADPHALARFWQGVTGFSLEGSEQDGEVQLSPPVDTHPGLLFIRVPEGKTAKNRVHIDVMPLEGTRDEAVGRALATGARMLADFREADGTGWVVLADPEGNEFCIERSVGERGLA
ncbi:MAG TPA: VOC family protein [Candidatus Dormibacteraeota bacterium]|jgi:predicted enzyme related to lactoylglutathione lyase|nr:VOC family protein [Candidatus Dormibacteraeota bacterium]